jgi:hypothetical protein
MIASTTAEATAPPRPWRTRAPTSSSTFGASPHSAEAAEHREPAEQHALAAEEVAEPPGDEQERAEGDQVAVQDPRQLGLDVSVEP